MNCCLITPMKCASSNVREHRLLQGSTSSPMFLLFWLRSSARWRLVAEEFSISLARRSASFAEMPTFLGSSFVVYRFSSQVDLTCKLQGLL